MAAVDDGCNVMEGPTLRLVSNWKILTKFAFYFPFALSVISEATDSAEGPSPLDSESLHRIHSPFERRQGERVVNLRNAMRAGYRYGL